MLLKYNRTVDSTLLSTVKWAIVPKVPAPVSTPPHLSSMLPVHTGTSRTRRKSFLHWKHSEIREFEGHEHVGPTSAAGQTDQPYLELHMRERETEDTQHSSGLDCTGLDIEHVLWLQKDLTILTYKQFCSGFWKPLSWYWLPQLCRLCKNSKLQTHHEKVKSNQGYF